MTWAFSGSLVHVLNEQSSSCSVPGAFWVPETQAGSLPPRNVSPGGSDGRWSHGCQVAWVMGAVREGLVSGA